MKGCMKDFSNLLDSNRERVDFLKVLSNNFHWPVGFAVGKDFSHLQRAKFYRCIFPPVT